MKDSQLKSASLPLMVALKLEGKRVLVIGGGSVACQRVQALRSSGSQISVVASQPRELLAKEYAQGSIHLENRSFQESDLADTDVVMVAIDDPHLSREIASMCRARGIVVNVADVPSLCDFYFCAVHRDGPVQVAVSTNGFGPGLAGKLRDELAAAMPKELQAAMTRFSKLRKRWQSFSFMGASERMQRLREIAKGMSWQQLSQLHPETCEPEFAQTSKLRAASPDCSSVVSLVGAGPGDPELLTLRALQRIQSAELVVADRLIPKAILELVQCELKIADKSPGRADLSQQELMSWVLSGVAQGKKVVRLKIGDPFLFGRGGEEVQELAEQGIVAEVIPGITSALAAPMAAGIPATMRGQADRITVFTAVGRGGTVPMPPSYDATTTYIALMGMRKLSQLTQSMCSRGFPGNLPAACVVHATGPDERVIRAPLKDLAEAVARAGLKPPGVIIVGEVAGAQKSLAHLVAAI